ncbi:MAG: hypothetical protein VX278_21070, partial [Myxococcota bacterium]|nr:hypothetical protein [Myxococcota bacterium]
PQLYIRSGIGYDVREDMGMAIEFWSTAILQESYGYQNDTELAWSGFKDWGRFRIKAGLVWHIDEIDDRNPSATLGLTYR